MSNYGPSNNENDYDPRTIIRIRRTRYPDVSRDVTDNLGSRELDYLNSPDQQDQGQLVQVNAQQEYDQRPPEGDRSQARPRARRRDSSVPSYSSEESEPNPRPRRREQRQNDRKSRRARSESLPRRRRDSSRGPLEQLECHFDTSFDGAIIAAAGAGIGALTAMRFAERDNPSRIGHKEKSWKTWGGALVGAAAANAAQKQWGGMLKDEEEKVRGKGRRLKNDAQDVVKGNERRRRDR